MIATRPPSSVPERLLGRPFGEAGLRAVREALASGPGLCRAQLAHCLCSRLGWRTVGGELSLMSARVALLRLEHAGWIPLPRPRNGNANRQWAVAEPDDWPEPRCAI